MEENSNIIIKIENPAYGGYGVGKHDGKVFFVDCAIPGDTVKVEVYGEHSNYSIARVSEIIESSPLRTAPPCPFFSLCGGCAYQNISYETELSFKKALIIEQLNRVAGLAGSDIPVIEIISGERYRYRSHTRFNTSGYKKGFYKKGTNELVEFPAAGCLLLADEINDTISKLRIPDGEKEIKVAMDCHGKTHVSYGNSKKLLIEEKEKDITFLRDISGFFQANRFLRSSMIDKVMEFCNLKTGSEFLDICSGCGFFSLPLAAASGRGYGFDIDSGSIKFARKNAAINKLDNVKFYNLPESEIRPDLYNPQSVVVDPPRCGLSKKGRKTLNAVKPESIVYVSCNPSTFSRDLRDFIKNGYRLEQLVFIDMFPCTYHIELISLITNQM